MNDYDSFAFPVFSLLLLLPPFFTRAIHQHSYRVAVDVYTQRSHSILDTVIGYALLGPPCSNKSSQKTLERLSILNCIYVQGQREIQDKREVMLILYIQKRIHCLEMESLDIQMQRGR